MAKIVLTNYEYTVVYNPRSPFETAVAHLLDRCQPIEGAFCNDAGDIMNVLGKSSPSPTLILFGDSFDMTGIETLLQISQQVKIFKYDPEAYAGICLPENVIVFCAETFHEHIPLIGAAVLLMEHILCVFTDYQSSAADATSGTHLLDGIISEPATFEDVIRDMNGIHGFDRIEKYVKIGEAIENYNIRRASRRVLDGTRYEIMASDGQPRKFLAIDNSDGLFDVSMRLPSNDNTNFVITYRPAGNLWKVNAFIVDGTAEELRQIVPWSEDREVSSAEMKKIIPPLFA